MVERLLLVERDVPLGAQVNVFCNGMDKAERIDDKVVVLKAMVGGVPARKKLYHMVDGKPIAGLEGAVEGTYFSPTIVYTPKNAPVDGRYAIFLSGEKMLDNEANCGPTPFEVTKRQNGELIVTSRYSLKHYGNKLDLPTDAQLVRLDN